MSQPTLSAALQRVAQRFAVRLPDRLDQLEAEATALSMTSSSDEFTSLERALHDLAGTAPTLGFAELGEAARDAEHQVERVRLDDEPYTKERLESLTASVRALRRTVQQAAAG